MSKSIDSMSSEELGKAKVLTYISLLCLVVFPVAQALEQVVVAGAVATFAAVFVMNGLGRTDVLFASQRWWWDHPVMRRIHFINAEGEIAGIVTAAIIYVDLKLLNPESIEHLHLPINEALTLLGLMSAGNLFAAHMGTLMNAAEKRLGTWAVLFLGSLAGSVTVQPSVAVFLSDFVATRLKSNDPDRKARAATALAASIGTGGGLLPFAAPPILIIWPLLQREFGWSITTLIMYVGLGCIGHAGVCAFLVARHLKSGNESGSSGKAVIPVLLLLLLVSAHIAQVPGIYAVDVGVGIGGAVWLFRTYSRHLQDLSAQFGLVTVAQREGNTEWVEIKERRFGASFQPVILSGLLLGLEVIGVAAEPFIRWLASLIPDNLQVFQLAVVLFFVTALVSHVADNALASRLFIGLPIVFIPSIGMDAAGYLAGAVIMGALFGGFLTIPANLPNFAINRKLQVGSGPWLRAALPLYLTAAIFVLWLWVSSLIFVA